ncbi:hypothetical protein As57867_022344, partial [Aphanomyces stellatus]
TRACYPTLGRWSGGFTWVITFTSRKGNVPTMTFAAAALLNANGGGNVPALAIEDATHPLTQPAGSQDGNAVGGSFLLSYNGVPAAAPCVIGTNTDSTNLITGPYNDVNLQNYLIAQFGFPSIVVFRSLPDRAMGFVWSITFSDKDTGGDVPPLVVASTAGLTGTGASLVNAEAIKGNQLSGTFQLTFNGQTTRPILFSATAADVAEAINSLDSILPSAVVVTRTGPYGPTASGSPDVNTQVQGYVWAITFTSATWKDPTADHSTLVAGNWVGPPAAWIDTWETGFSKAWGRQVGPLWANSYRLACLKQGLTVTANDASATCVTGVATPGVGPLAGTFRLQLDTTNSPFMSVRGSFPSAAIRHNAWGNAIQSRSDGSSMQEILQSMANIGTVAVTRSAVDVTTGGYKWTITFLNDKAPCVELDSLTGQCASPGDVPALSVFSTSLVGPTLPVVTVCEASTTNCNAANMNGVILRSDFTVFKVTGDPGVEGRFSLSLTCQGATGGSDCSVIVGGFVVTTPVPALATTLLQYDRFFL